jgi:3-oxoacyl-[acyl-carrier protein] reductase
MTTSESPAASPGTADTAFGGRLHGRTIIVTGGASGLGRHYCGHLAAHGARVVVADLDGDGASVLAEQLTEALGPGHAHPVQVDATSPQSAQQMIESTIATFGTIDVLINNVGVYPHVDFVDITLEAWQEVVRVNLDSVYVCSWAVLPTMKAQGSGKIVNVATNLVWIGLPSMVHYVAAKSGVVGFTRSLAREVGADGITVNALAPGAVAPPLEYLDDTARARLQTIVQRQCVQRPLHPDDLVGPMLFLASSDSDFVSGEILTVDGGLTDH